MVLCFDDAIASCQVNEERTSQMKQVSKVLLKASKMFYIPITVALQCSAQCLSEPDCIYITRDAAGTNCTLYTVGSDIYDVNGLLTYAVQFKNIQVI